MGGERYAMAPADPHSRSGPIALAAQTGQRFVDSDDRSDGSGTLPRTRGGLRGRLYGGSQADGDGDDELAEAATGADAPVAEPEAAINWGPSESADTFLSTVRTPWEDLATLQRELELFHPGTRRLVSSTPAAARSSRTGSARHALGAADDSPGARQD